MEVPLWNRNQGGKARASADLERAAWQYLVVRQRIESEVRLAAGEYDSAEQALEILRRRSLAAADDNVRRVKRAYEAGDVSHLVLVEVTRQRLDIESRVADLAAQLRRAAAELDRSVGGNMRTRIEALAAIVGAIAAISCGGRARPPERGSPPAVVVGARPERDLATITLTAEAELRLGIEVSTVERRAVAQAIEVGGEVVVPAGKSLIVTAPMAGTVARASPPLPGSTLRRGQLVIEFAPLPAASEIAAAHVRVDAARQKVKRASQLAFGGFRDDALGRRGGSGACIG